METKESNPINFLYVGVDVHKDQHTAVAANCFGHALLEKEINNSEEEFAQLVEKVKILAEAKSLKPIFGLEDTSAYGQRLALHLCQENFPVKVVSPIFVDRERRKLTHPEKSDSQDALGVARALISMIGTLPDFSISKTNEIAKNLKDSVVDREFLVKEQTRIKNQLHRLLHKSYNSEYREKFKNPFSVKALEYWSKHPVPADLSGNVLLKSQIRRKIRRLRGIKKEVAEIEEEMKILVNQIDQKLETLNGCGLVLASSVLAEIKDIDRFDSPNALAQYGGFCPKEKSSGKRIRHIKTKSGNRKLNKAVHRIALSQLGRQGNIYSKNYFQKKIAEGKNKSQAICCLKRKLISIIFMMLKHKAAYNYAARC
jgi:transposase